MHGNDQITQMDIFYHAMNYSLKGIIYVDFCGAFKRKSVEKANQLIEDLAKSNYRAPTETSGNNSRLRGGGMIELNKMSAIEAKLDALVGKMNNHERRIHSANVLGIEEGGENKCITDEGLAHEGPYQGKEAHFVSGNISYNFKPNKNFPTHYTPALRNHENFSYGSGVQHGLRPMQNFQQQYAPQGFQGQQQQGSQRAENQDQRRS